MTRKKEKSELRWIQKRASLRRKGLTLSGEEFSAGKKGALIGKLNKYCGNSDARKIVLGWLFFHNDRPPLEPRSSRDLSPGQWLAIEEWIDADPDNQWEPSEDFIVEIELIKKAALSAFGAKIEDYDIVGSEDFLLECSIGLGGQIKDTDEK